MDYKNWDTDDIIDWMQGYKNTPVIHTITGDMTYEEMFQELYNRMQSEQIFLEKLV